MSVFRGITAWIKALFWTYTLRPFLGWIRWLIDWLLNRWHGGGPVGDDKCCGLAVPWKECMWQGQKSNFVCPEGFHKHWWNCCEGTQIISCGECTVSTSSCWGGPWECSIWWVTPQTC